MSLLLLFGGAPQKIVGFEVIGASGETVLNLDRSRTSGSAYVQGHSQITASNLARSRAPGSVSIGDTSTGTTSVIRNRGASVDVAAQAYITEAVSRLLVLANAIEETSDVVVSGGRIRPTNTHIDGNMFMFASLTKRLQNFVEIGVNVQAQAEIQSILLGIGKQLGLTINENSTIAELIGHLKIIAGHCDAAVAMQIHPTRSRSVSGFTASGASGAEVMEFARLRMSGVDVIVEVDTSLTPNRITGLMSELEANADFVANLVRERDTGANMQVTSGMKANINNLATLGKPFYVLFSDYVYYTDKNGNYAVKEVITKLKHD